MNKELRILLVDDSLLMRMRVEDILRELGYLQIKRADDGRSALIELGRSPFDLVITDSIMPLVGGLELIRRIRCDRGLADLPTLIMTAEPGGEQERLAKNLGANGCIYKPFSADELQRKIEDIFALVECAL